MDSKKGFLQGLIVGAVISGGLFVASILVVCYECTCNFLTCGKHITEDGPYHFVGFIQSWNFLWIALAICLVCGLIGALYLLYFYPFHSLYLYVIIYVFLYLIKTCTLYFHIAKYLIYYLVY